MTETCSEFVRSMRLLVMPIVDLSSVVSPLQSSTGHSCSRKFPWRPVESVFIHSWQPAKTRVPASMATRIVGGLMCNDGLITSAALWAGGGNNSPKSAMFVLLEKAFALLYI
jgi:hypothetical protein